LGQKAKLLLLLLGLISLDLVSLLLLKIGGESEQASNDFCPSAKFMKERKLRDDERNSGMMFQKLCIEELKRV
jgi:hypothetical protein